MGQLTTGARAGARGAAIRGRAAAAVLTLSASGALAALMGCGGDQAAPRARLSTPEPRALPAPKAPEAAEYILVDIDRFRDRAVTLDKPGRIGVIIDGARFVVEEGRARAVREDTRTPVVGAARVPPWLGGGFLFWQSSAIFTADSFEGKLSPFVATPQPIIRVSFGPQSALVRGSEGERWAFELPLRHGGDADKPGELRPQDPWKPRAPAASGPRVPIAPLGLVDVEALADGRAMALTEAGGLLTSTRRGETWDDLTGKLAGAPVSLSTSGEDLWVTDETGRAHKLERGGTLRAFDRPPAPQRLQKERDPRWNNAQSPRDIALISGAKLDDQTAVVAASGDVARVDVRSGDIKSIYPGHLPPTLKCDAIRVPGTIVIVCAAPGEPSVVASGVLGDEGLHIERTFPLDRPFYASDDGALVFGGPCSPEGSSPWAACARDPGGRWHEHSVESAATRAEKDVVTQGAVEGVRWVPRADKAPIAILARAAVTSIDPASGEPSVWQVESVPGELDGLINAVRPPLPGGSGRLGGAVVDRRWEALPSGSLRGWVKPGRSVDVSPKGALAFSAFKFDRASVAGASGLAVTSDSRVWQTLDRGAAWVEVAAPPGRSFTLGSCSMVGCSMGLWARIGWQETPPDPKPSAAAQVPMPLLARAPMPEIACAPAGEERTAEVPQSAVSPVDRGIGATKTPFSQIHPNGETLDYDRVTFSRGLQNPPRSSVGADESVPFAMMHGFRVQMAEVDTPQGVIMTPVVSGPSTSFASFRETFTFIEPFDPTGAVRSASAGGGAFTSAARAAGLQLSELFTGAFEGDGFIPVLPLDPTGKTDIFFTLRTSGRSLAGVLSAKAKESVRLLGARVEIGSPVSAAELPGGDIALLTSTPEEGLRVMRISAAGVTDMGGIPSASASELQPANPDALAVGPQGALAIIRTPSGEEPASREDPALLIELRPGASPSAGVPAQRLIPLAPWSTLTSADDPACQSDASGYRAVLQTKGPWLRLRGARPGEDLLATSMLARVRWSAARVCLEAVELPEATRSFTPDAGEMQTYVIARFTAPRTAPPAPAIAKAEARGVKAGAAAQAAINAGRLGVLLGAELHQALTCAVPPR